MELEGGRFIVEEELGAGTFARVHRATDTRTGLPCAVKLLNSKAVREARQRFVAEVKVLARLRHPYILEVLSAGAVGDQGYLVTELAEGGSLLDLLRRGEHPTVDQTVVWAVQVLSALGAAHAEAIVHRDVKPSNILLDGRAGVRLADFGVALQIAPDLMRLTRTGAALGTAIYMAPEQRLDARKVDHRADLYAVGTTLYRILTGLNPQDLFVAGLDSERWQRVPSRVRRPIWRATRLDPEERYPDAATMAEALIQALPEERRRELRATAGCDPAGFPAPAPSLLGKEADLDGLGSADSPAPPRVPLPAPEPLAQQAPPPVAVEPAPSPEGVPPTRREPSRPEAVTHKRTGKTLRILLGLVPVLAVIILMAVYLLQA